MFSLPTIYKYPKPLPELNDVIELSIEEGAKVLSVINQNECLCIYALVDPNTSKVRRYFRIAGTGHPLTLPKWAAFVGTVAFQQGRLVFHVYDLGTRGLK